MYKILIIEDEAINQMLLKQCLLKQGAEVSVAANGVMGLQ